MGIEINDWHGLQTTQTYYELKYFYQFDNERNEMKQNERNTKKKRSSCRPKTNQIRFLSLLSYFSFSHIFEYRKQNEQIPKYEAAKEEQEFDEVIVVVIDTFVIK